ncbi:hypothetical protein AALP_AA4G234700 [Arabis alpina]|uniref:RING-type domain-containing protein n=1 Tax=Arabis alpina TaxID=50452 RepID=A0A087H560_ARAAL|nr:hypothetical protein AALP_AA4G234700 [Arabis alpina]
MFIESLIKISESIIEIITISTITIITLRLFLRFASYLASQPWRRYRTFTNRRRRRWWKFTAEEAKPPPYCSICLLNATEGEIMRRLTVCGHCFHGDCIDPWIEKKSTCPLCRGQIPPAPAEYPLIALFVPPGVIELFTKGSFVSDT